MNVTLGALFQMTCEPKGVPYPIISWYHNGMHVTNTYDGERRLTVEVKHYDMAGRIECVANNGVGNTPKSAGILLIVNCKLIKQAAGNKAYEFRFSSARNKNC